VPSFTVVAGPNGSGKTTLTRYGREAFQQLSVLDPDAIAQALTGASDKGGSAIDAGREVLYIAEAALANGESFIVETTLSGKTYLHMAKRAQTLGYTFVFIFVGTSGVQINIERVHRRVLKGGHDVPEEDQRRRFGRSMANMRVALSLSDRAVFYDNSTEEGHRKIATKRDGAITVYEPLPTWAEFLREEKN